MPFDLESRRRFGSYGEEYVCKATAEESVSVKEITELKKHQSIQELSLSGCDLSKKGIVAALVGFFKVSYGLEKISFAGCNLQSLTDEDFTSLMENLSHIKNLQSIDLAQNLGLSEQKIQAIHELADKFKPASSQESDTNALPSLEINLGDCGIDLGRQGTIQGRTGSIRFAPGTAVAATDASDTQGRKAGKKKGGGCAVM